MRHDVVITSLLVGAVVYKSLDLFILREKVSQAHLRGTHSNLPIVNIWAKLFDRIYTNISTVIMIFFLLMVGLLGVTLIIIQHIGTQAFVDAKVVSVAIVAASIYQAVIAIVVEKFQTSLERSH